MLEKLELTNFKAFERLTVSLRGDALLVGPNNAGKSTVIGALRACAAMLRHASSRSPTLVQRDRNQQVYSYPFSAASGSLVTENLRHEFREAETRVEARFSGSAVLRAVWPSNEAESGDEDSESEGDDLEYYEYNAPDVEAQGYFYLMLANNLQPKGPADVRRLFPSLGVIPILTPIDHDEEVKSWDYLKRNLDSRLASRHFRNQLLRIDDVVPEGLGKAWAAYVGMLKEWLPEIRLHDIATRDNELDLYYEEVGSRVQKEAYWAGDGIQVWLQLLLHLLRVRNCGTVVLDEPDVYLHPDLQRRLVRLLDSLPQQFVTATHSAELLSEAAGDRIIWVDKSRRKAVRAPSDDMMADLSRAIGSQFNLRLARALRSKAVLFVEGDDMKIIRMLARTMGAANVASETGMAQVPLRGFDNWERVEPFEWLVNSLLEKSVRVMVVLDRDYRSTETNAAIIDRFRGIGIRAHIWRRTELENYLLVPSAVARLTGASEQWVQGTLGEIAESLRHEIEARVLATRHLETGGPRKHIKSVAVDVLGELEEAWAQESNRLDLCPGKDVLSRLSKALQETKYRSISPRLLAGEMTRGEIPHEVVSVIDMAQDLV